jgi:hypothetical protein
MQHCLGLYAVRFTVTAIQLTAKNGDHLSVHRPLGLVQNGRRLRTGMKDGRRRLHTVDGMNSNL